MTHITWRLSGWLQKNRDQLRNTSLGNRVRAAFVTDCAVVFYDWQCIIHWLVVLYWSIQLYLLTYLLTYHRRRLFTVLFIMQVSPLNLPPFRLSSLFYLSFPYGPVTNQTRTYAIVRLFSDIWKHKNGCVKLLQRLILPGARTHGVHFTGCSCIRYIRGTSAPVNTTENKKLSYRRGTARRTVSAETVRNVAQANNTD